jgi:D-alanyl-D-alanine carboxypeptidase
VKLMNTELLSDAVDYAAGWTGYQQRTRRLPGVAVAVAHEGRILLERAYGVADLERGTPLRTDHRFRIASHSKMFTASAAMLLHERGLLDLDDRIGRWLDWVPDAEGELGRVTIRQLLSHSAGVIRDGVDTGFWTLRNSFPDEGEFRRLLAEASVVYAPNVRFKYSNFGFTLVGLVIAAGPSSDGSRARRGRRQGPVTGAFQRSVRKGAQGPAAHRHPDHVARDRVLQHRLGSLHVRRRALPGELRPAHG